MIGPENGRPNGPDGLGGGGGGNGNSDIFATTNTTVPVEVINQIGTLNNNQINRARQLLLKLIITFYLVKCQL